MHISSILPVQLNCSMPVTKVLLRDDKIIKVTVVKLNQFYNLCENKKAIIAQFTLPDMAEIVVIY